MYDNPSISGDSWQTRRVALLFAFVATTLVGIAIGGWMLSEEPPGRMPLSGAGLRAPHTAFAAAGALLGISSVLVWRKRRPRFDPATRDPHTGLYLREFVDESLRNQVALEDRDGHNRLALVLVDIDGLAQLRERYGGAAIGRMDALLGRQLRSQARAGDLPTQLGEGRFAVYLQCGEREQAEAYCRRVAMLLAGDQIDVRGDVLKVSATMRIAVRRPGEPLDVLYERASTQLDTVPQSTPVADTAG